MPTSSTSEVTSSERAPCSHPGRPQGRRPGHPHALRFSLTGRPHGKKIREDAEWMASHIVEHLLRANYRISQRPPSKDSSTGRWWGDTPGHNES
jgi:hypothetical protein